MKRSLYSLLAISGLVSLILCTGCHQPGNKKSSAEIEHILKGRYGKKFFSISEDLSKRGTGTMEFMDIDGITFIVWIELEDGDLIFTPDYDITEYYTQAYYKNHPELFDDFTDDGHNFNVENHTMYYDSFDDIDETVQFTVDRINEMDRIIWDSRSKGISRSDYSIRICPADSKYEEYFYSRISIPGKGELSRSAEEIAEKIKKEYVRVLQDNNDTEELSKLTEEQIKMYSR